MTSSLKPYLVWENSTDQLESPTDPQENWARYKLSELLQAQRENRVLWAIVAFGLGVGIYFLLPFEPLFYPLLITDLILASCVVVLRMRPVFRAFSIALLLIACGTTVGAIRTHQQQAPILKAELGPVSIEAIVVQTEQTEDGFIRLTLSPTSVDRLPREETPKFIRLVVRTKAKAIAPGQYIKLRAVLTTLPTPAAPGAYDFARQAYFEQLGALGYAVSSPVILDEGDDFGFETVARQRNFVTSSIYQHLPGESGTIAAALLTGDKTAIPDDISKAYRDAGLAHLLAISGLHFGLITGLIYFTARAGLALIPRLALNHPIKAYAAITSWFGAFGYLLLTGAPLPAQRAFIMVTVMICGTLLGRQPLSLRVAAFAAFLILLFTPEALFSIGFQMSFAAVMALIAAYEALQPVFQRQKERFQSMSGRFALYLLSVALSTLVAELAIAPIAAYHFNQFSSYGLFANMLAVPLTAFWIMPWGALSLFLTPFGLEGIALQPMGWGIDILSQIALITAEAPGAHIIIPQYPAAAFYLLLTGGLCLTLGRAQFRFISLAFFALAAVLVFLKDTPDILVSRDGKMVAIKSAEGVFLNTKRGSGFTKNIWQRQWGEAGNQYWLNSEKFQEGHQLGCDTQGCVFHWPEQEYSFAISVAKTDLAIMEDCHSTDILITPLAASSCNAPALIIDAHALEHGGSHALYFQDEGTIHVIKAQEKRGHRPWSVQ